MIPDKHTYLNHFKQFQRFLENIGIPAKNWKDFFQLGQKQKNLSFLIPVLKQIQFNLCHIYPDDFRRGTSLLVLSYLNELEDEQLFFSLGFMPEETYEKVEKEIIFSMNDDFDAPLNIQKIFELMLNKSDSEYCVIPLKKEYIDYVKEIRQASELISLYYLPGLAKETINLGIDQEPLKIYNSNSNQAEYQTLKTFILVQNDLEARFLNHKYPYLCENTEILLNEYFHRRLDPLMNIGINKMDPILHERVRALSSFFKLLLPPDMHLSDRKKEQYKLKIKDDLIDALRLNPDYFNSECNLWNEMNAEWIQKGVPIKRRLLTNRRNQIPSKLKLQMPLWKVYQYLKQNQHEQ